MTGRPECFVDESDTNKKYFPIIISTLINEKTNSTGPTYPVGQLTPVSPNRVQIVPT